MSEGRLRIAQLTAENVKRIVAVDITPGEENLVVIGGENGAGKSSTLDCIAYVLGGKSLCPSKPIRDGQEHGEAVVSITKEINGAHVPWLVAKRVFTGKDSYLSVTNGEGFKAGSPQQVLDELVGLLTFDPLEFANQSPVKQLETLKAITGVDVSALDDDRKQKYAERTQVNRRVSELKAQLKDMPPSEGAPDEEVSVVDLMGELSRRQDANASNEAIRETLDEMEALACVGQENVELAELAVKRAQDDLMEAKKALKRSTGNLEAQREIVAGLNDEDVEEVRTKINGAQELNRKRERRAAFLRCEEELAITKTQSAELTAAIKAIDTERQQKIAGAKFPIEGLSFSGDGVEFDGIPFEQSSQAEKLRVSVAMGIAMNPKLKVMLIRDGSLLDDRNFELIKELAHEADAQIWMERVGDGKEITVLIEEGRVKRAATQTEEAEDEAGN